MKYHWYVIGGTDYMYCKFCGKPLADSARFCGVCGKEQETPLIQHGQESDPQKQNKSGHLHDNFLDRGSCHYSFVIYKGFQDRNG